MMKVGAIATAIASLVGHVASAPTAMDGVVGADSLKGGTYQVEMEIANDLNASITTKYAMLTWGQVTLPCDQPKDGSKVYYAIDPKHPEAQTVCTMTIPPGESRVIVAKESGKGKSKSKYGRVAAPRSEECFINVSGSEALRTSHIQRSEPNGITNETVVIYK